MYGFAENDPPTWQAAVSLASLGYKVHLIQTGDPQLPVQSKKSGVIVHTVSALNWLQWLRPLHNFLKWRAFVRKVAGVMDSTRPSLVVTIMLHSIAALPTRSRSLNYKLVSCIYDIPPLEFAGKRDRPIMKRGWRLLKHADLVWASDAYKGALAYQLGQLLTPPLVCHNCPACDYLPNPTNVRDGWLRSELQRLGADIGSTGGSILLRAGAVGVAGGIEETLAGMKELPPDFIFVMMGRPSEAYRERLLVMIANLGLQRRVFLFDRPSDDIWKKALMGADIGHLIQGPFLSDYLRRSYELNSSLSNNRLFQYMAAGLPIISYDDPRMSELHSELSCFRVARIAYLENDIQMIWYELGCAPVVRHQLGCEGRKAHQTIYNWEYQFGLVSRMLSQSL